MVRKFTIFLLLIFLWGCSTTAPVQQRPAKKPAPRIPALYDKYGFPVGGIYPLIDDKGFIVETFRLNLKRLTGFGCASRKTPQVNYYMHAEALEYFERMQAAARKSGVQLSICSAYRDYAHQKQLKRQLPGKAIHPGYSEHHLGTTVDLVGVTWRSQRFRWLSRNAHRFGFILTYYRRPELGVGEANHWRFVGVETAETFYRLYGKRY